MAAMIRARSPGLSFRRHAERIKSISTTFQIRGVCSVYIVLLRLASRLGRRPQPVPADGADVLLTGTFHSDNWVLSHIKPLADSSACRQVRLVTTRPLPGLAKVTAIYPPRWLVSSIGRVPARLLTFLVESLKQPPDFLGAFHLLFNGMIAALLAKIVGTRSMYFCVGGPAEVIGGGIHAENRFFSRLNRPDDAVQRQLTEVVANCDLVVTMGSSALRYFREKGVRGRIEVISGGVDPDRFARPRPAIPEFDLIIVARLAPIKRIDLFIGAVAKLARIRPDITAAIVGDGELRAELEGVAQRLNVTSRITFAGQQTDVASWLARSRVFVLTSDSEGLALSLMEAMTAGLPGVVSRVGDLGDLITDGVNGYLVTERDSATFAGKISQVLDPAFYPKFSAQAREAAARYSSATTSRRWDQVLRGANP